MKGICFKESSFNAVIEGRKTQTRCIVKPQTDSPIYKLPGSTEYFYRENGCKAVMLKPRYQVGETVYLKEPYKFGEYTDFRVDIFNKYSGITRKEISWVEVETDFGISHNKMDDIINSIYRRQENSKSGWLNKLFMPEWCAVKFIKILNVRFERLEDISDEDCAKEGIYIDSLEKDYFHYYDYENRYYCSSCEETGRKRLITEALEDRKRFGFDSEYIDDDWIKEELDSYYYDDFSDELKICDICGKDLSVFKNYIDEKHYYEPQHAYDVLFDTINGKGAWDSNPYVWVYEFKLLKNK